MQDIIILKAPRRDLHTRRDACLTHARQPARVHASNVAPGFTNISAAPLSGRLWPCSAATALEGGRTLARHAQAAAAPAAPAAPRREPSPAMQSPRRCWARRLEVGASFASRARGRSRRCRSA
eukprot:5417246-Prymnesium_polylepis.1